ncbi:MAG: hypothetical protein ACRC57_02635 [Sarcina sp.]
MIKKNIINSTIAFTLVAIFIYISMLGFHNMEKTLPITILLIVSIVALTKFEEDAYKKILQLTFLLSFSIILAYFAGVNIFLSIAINLIWIPILLYISINHFKTPIYFLLLCTYLINLVFKVSPNTFIYDYKYLIVIFALAILIKFIIRKFRHKKDFGLSMNRFTFNNATSLALFTIELGVITAILYFIITYFKLPFGNWILFGGLAFLNPYSQEGIYLDKHTLIGANLGIIRILIVVTFVPLYPVRMGIMAIGAYILIFSNRYRTRAMGGLMFALSMTEIGSSFNGINLSELLFRVIYILIALSLAFVYCKTIRRVLYKKVLISNQVLPIYLNKI